MGNRKSYELLAASEQLRYENCTGVHELPGIFHYWSNRYLRPKLQSLGFNDPDAIFETFLAAQCTTEAGGPKRFLSLGAGNCDLEIALSLKLRAGGHHEFLFDCLDLNPAMLERGRLAAKQAGVGDHLAFAEGDVNVWNAAQEYDAIVANYFLHHVVELEHVFEQVQCSLKPAGTFLIAEMIGRNGHRRWPEALTLVHEFWRKLPPSYRFNRVSGRYEEMYEDQDCSAEGFEGIRAQDILPLLIDRFQFRLFAPFANLIDPFVDRNFGPNFDPALAWDRQFIDQVHLRDEQELSSGGLTPTHMYAVVAREAADTPVILQHLTPEFCVRRNVRIGRGSSGPAAGPYDGLGWPRDAQQELQLVRARLGESAELLRQTEARTQHIERELEKELEKGTAWSRELSKEIEARTVWALDLKKALEERTAWALDLQKDLERATASGQLLQSELEVRTAWALDLEKVLQERTAWALSLDKELEQMTAQVHSLDAEAQKQAARALQLENDRLALENELRTYLHNPLHYGVRLLKGILQRLRRLLQ